MATYLFWGARLAGLGVAASGSASGGASRQAKGLLGGALPREFGFNCAESNSLRSALVQWLVCCSVAIPAARPISWSSARVGTQSRTLPPRLMVIS